ncbi:hypothetical protein TBH_C0199 [Thiolapillus brandeum]|uniref:Uncharacterized protein n=1 Tax=Thiolapillus brandeum TaxID=1076588 RepID=A0A7U6GGD8_9GAMM|nr:hypothetical protein TBH_C0199 [Thiolapillus brandeum]
MYRMYGPKNAPAFSALPPSLAVVCHGRRALKMLPAFPAFPQSLEVMRRSGDVQDVRAEKCSCIFGTSALPGGRMPRAQGTENAPGISSISSVPGGHAQERRCAGYTVLPQT